MKEEINKENKDFYPIDFFMQSPAEKVVETAIKLKRKELARRLALIMT